MVGWSEGQRKAVRGAESAESAAAEQPTGVVSSQLTMCAAGLKVEVVKMQGKGKALLLPDQWHFVMCF